MQHACNFAIHALCMNLASECAATGAIAAARSLYTHTCRKQPCSCRASRAQAADPTGE